MTAAAAAADDALDVLAPLLATTLLLLDSVADAAAVGGAGGWTTSFHWLSTSFFTYTTRRSLLPRTFSGRYGCVTKVSPNTQMSEPCQVTCGPIVLEIAINSFWPSGVTPAVSASTRRRFSSTAFRFLVAIWKGGDFVFIFLQTAGHTRLIDVLTRCILRSGGGFGIVFTSSLICTSLQHAKFTTYTSFNLAWPLSGVHSVNERERTSAETIRWSRKKQNKFTFHKDYDDKHNLKGIPNVLKGKGGRLVTDTGQ